MTRTATVLANIPPAKVWVYRKSLMRRRPNVIRCSMNLLQLGQVVQFHWYEILKLLHLMLQQCSKTVMLQRCWR